MLPNKARGVRRVDDRRVLNGICWCWVLRSGAPRRDLPDRYGPCTTCYNRFVRLRRVEVWGIMDALAAAHDAAVQMINTSIVRVHQHAATRHDKLAANYLAFIQLASIRLWLRVCEFTALVQIGCRASRLASPVA
jgi:transposase